jgi:hypothetical protein
MFNGPQLYRVLVEFDRGIPQSLEETLQSLNEGEKTYGH